MINFFGVSQVPPHTGTLGNAKKSGADSIVIPPVGQNLMSENGPEKPFNKLIPPTATAGNSFKKEKPSEMMTFLFVIGC